MIEQNNDLLKERNQIATDLNLARQHKADLEKSKVENTNLSSQNTQLLASCNKLKDINNQTREIIRKMQGEMNVVRQKLDAATAKVATQEASLKQADAEKLAVLNKELNEFKTSYELLKNEN